MIKETGNYLLSTIDGEYAVVNKATGVKEFTTRQLPGAIEALYQLETAYRLIEGRGLDYYLQAEMEDGEDTPNKMH